MRILSIIFVILLNSSLYAQLDFCYDLIQGAGCADLTPRENSLSGQNSLTGESYNSSSNSEMLRYNIQNILTGNRSAREMIRENLRDEYEAVGGYVQARQMVQAMTQNLNAHQSQLRDFKEQLQKRHERLNQISNSNKEILRSSRSDHQKKALLRLNQIKLDDQDYKGEIGDHFNLVRSKYWSVSEADLVSEKSYTYLSYGAGFYSSAREDYSNGDHDTAKKKLQLSNTFLDIALGSTPFVGMFKDAYEALRGESLVTGEDLSLDDRMISALGFSAGLLTGGVGSVAIKATLKYFPEAGQVFKNAANWLGIVSDSKILSRMGVDEVKGVFVSARKSIPIKTPFGKATQEMTKDAITARAKVQNGGYIYRLGKRGRSQTGKDAQFWSLEHPKTPGYAQKYGIPEENIANADFIERATIKDGSNFVTRKAPAVGNNKGGGIEIVTTKDGVNIESHSTLD